MEYSQNIVDQANKAIANKSPLSFEAICAFLQKKEDGQAKKDKQKMKKRLENQSLANTPSQPLWGEGAKYDTQAEYQRACLGSKWN